MMDSKYELVNLSMSGDTVLTLLGYVENLIVANSFGHVDLENVDWLIEFKRYIEQAYKFQTTTEIAPDDGVAL